MHKLFFDYETYSEVDLKKVGAWAYSLHPSTEILSMAYAIEEDDPILWLPTEREPGFVHRVGDFGLHAWYSFFEYSIWHNVLKWPQVPIKYWHDTAARAAVRALPRGLLKCGRALKVPEEMLKSAAGTRLINQLCKPQKRVAKNPKYTREELLLGIYEYNKQDVVAERYISKLLKPLSPAERKVWELDQEINLRGVPVDVKSVKQAKANIDECLAGLYSQVVELTDGQVLDTNKRDQVIAFIKSLGYELENYQKDYLAKVIDDPNLPELARQILDVRLLSSHVAVAKYDALHRMTEHTNRLHGCLLYHGADTGRWSSMLAQLHNLPRPKFKAVESCIKIFDNPELIKVIFGELIEPLSSCLRGMICAEPGKKLIAADYNSIEAIIIAWLAGQKNVLDDFVEHGTIYESTASKIYKKPVEDITEDERFVGKTATLSLGYQGGAKAFMGMAKTYNVDIDEAFAESVKTKWREANSNIVRFWYGLEDAAKKAVSTPGKVYSYRLIKFCVVDNVLYCRLPSGRRIAYNEPRLAPGKYGKKIEYMGRDAFCGHKWSKLDTYGGKLAENVTQGVARDVMVNGMFNAKKAGYDLILTVHDSEISEVDEGVGSVEEYVSLLCKTPSWAEGLPIAAEGYEAQRFSK